MQRIERITPLENLLFEDHQGSYRASLMRQLDAEEVRLNQLIHQPCSEDERRKMVQQRAAIGHARAVIDAIWNIYHMHS